jgi:small subunit ribosomal protein S2
LKQRLAAAEKGEITYRPADGLSLAEEEEQTSEKPVQDANLSELGEVGIDNADEIVTKLENARDRDGRRMGHRIRISA